MASAPSAARPMPLVWWVLRPRTMAGSRPESSVPFAAPEVAALAHSWVCSGLSPAPPCHGCLLRLSFAFSLTGRNLSGNPLSC